MPEFEKTKLEGVWIIKPTVHADARGFFLESFSDRWFAKQGLSVRFVQDNHSYSKQTGVLRGLHFQLPPSAQAKLIRITRGEVLDIAVDIRSGSPTYGQWERFILNQDNKHMLYIPAGFAHGFCTTQPDTEMQYKVSDYYHPDKDSGIRWDDPDLSIDWPVYDPMVSEKDSQLGFLKDFKSPFNY